MRKRGSALICWSAARRAHLRAEFKRRRTPKLEIDLREHGRRYEANEKIAERLSEPARHRAKTGITAGDPHNAMHAPPPKLLVRAQRRVDIDHSVQSTSDGHSIFEGLRRTLARVREHRVRRVTEQRHRAAAPSWKRFAIE